MQPPSEMTIPLRALSNGRLALVGSACAARAFWLLKPAKMPKVRAPLVHDVEVGSTMAALQLTFAIVHHRDSGDRVGPVVREQPRRVLRSRVDERRRERKHLVGDLYRSGRIRRDVSIVGHDDGDRLTHEAHDVAGHRRPFEIRQSARKVGVGPEVGRRPHPDNAWGRQRGSQIDRRDARMGMRRHHERRERRPRG